MSYRRVIPRDLFNEANLLKCLGQLYIALENTSDHQAAFTVDDVNLFDIQQDDSDGSIAVINLPFAINRKVYHLSRPLNSREPWPLYASRGDVVAAVFDASGALSAEFRELLKDGA